MAVLCIILQTTLVLIVSVMPLSTAWPPADCRGKAKNPGMMNQELSDRLEMLSPVSFCPAKSS